MEKPTLEWAFDQLGSAFPGWEADLEILVEMRERLRTRLQEPHRAYHNENHVLHVVSCLNAWAGGDLSKSLVAAALYHDAIYDPTRHDNEAQSAKWCSEELIPISHPISSLKRIADLIELTVHHTPSAGDIEGILLCDADLSILGSTPTEYESYTKAIRQEYSHVSDSAWCAGRAKVMQRFLERPRIYHGNWDGVEMREAQARLNIDQEITALSTAGV